MKSIRDGYSRKVDTGLESPTREMIADLAAGVLAPTATLEELSERYCVSVPSHVDLEACMSHACAVHAQTVGSVLVITDRDNQIAFGQVTDDNFEEGDPLLASAYRVLIASIPRWHIEKETRAIRMSGQKRQSIEYPISIMPAYDYLDRHGPQVSRYGTYLVSYNAPVPVC